MIRYENVSKTYGRGAEQITALDGVSLEVPKGCFAAFMGPSGSGKSTLLNLASGLDAPSAGEIWIGGRATSGLSDDDWTLLRRSSIGIIFQLFNLLPTLTARENVALPLNLANNAAGHVETRVNELLERVGMTDRKNHRAMDLSGGEMQRVAIARALVHRPSILIADEPTGNLDSRRGEEILDLIRLLSKDEGSTVLMATHSAEAAKTADVVHALRDGRILS